jgi:hypothetical protein
LCSASIAASFDASILLFWRNSSGATLGEAAAADEGVAAIECVGELEPDERGLP